jgi:hypothetical protein
MEAIPYIIVTLIAFMLLGSMVRIIISDQLRDSQYIFLLVTFIMFTGGLELVSGHYWMLPLPLLTIFTILGVEFLSRGKDEIALKISSFGLGMIVLAFVTGHQIDTRIFDRAADRYTIILKNGTLLQGELLKSGDRGVLFFIPSTKEIQFRRWESIDLIKRTTADFI